MIINNPNAGNIAHAVWDAADRTLTSGYGTIFSTVNTNGLSVATGAIVDFRANPNATTQWQAAVIAPTGATSDQGWYDGTTYTSTGNNPGPITTRLNIQQGGAGMGFVIKNSGASAAYTVYATQGFYQ